MHCSCEFFSLMCLSQVHPFIYLQEMTNAGTSVCRFRNLSSESWHSWCADSATNASWLEWSTNKFFMLICMFCSLCAISNFLSFVRMVYLCFISKLRYWFWHIIFILFSSSFHWKAVYDSAIQSRNKQPTCYISSGNKWTCENDIFHNSK